MKKKGRVLLIAAIVGVSVAGIVAFGAGAKKEKEPLLTGTYDVSPDDSAVAFTAVEEGRTTVNWQNAGEERAELIDSVEEPWSVTDIAFLPGGDDIAIAASLADGENPESRIYLKKRSGEEKEIMKAKGLITEMEFAEDGEKLYYLFAGVFTNYSPITGARPHDMDIYALDMATGTNERVTELKVYEMSSLALSPDKKELYISMPGSGEAETAEEIFAEKDRLYTVELGGNGQAGPSFLDEENVFEAAIDPKGERAAFIMIANPDDGGTFEYELYEKDIRNGKVSKLTDYKRQVTRPRYSRSGNHLYYMANKRFPARDTDFRLYKADEKGGDPVEIPLVPAE